jgi:hypothetical protein
LLQRVSTSFHHQLLLHVLRHSSIADQHDSLKHLRLGRWRVIDELDGCFILLHACFIMRLRQSMLTLRATRHSKASLDYERSIRNPIVRSHVVHIESMELLEGSQGWRAWGMRGRRHLDWASPSC